MSLVAQTHPELEIICRILRQASVPLATADQFDQQWTPAYLRQCFQWTDHLAALLSPAAARRDRTDEPPSPAAVVASFFESSLLLLLQRAPGRMPLQEELLSPSTALRRRLLSNPGLSDSARMAILCLDRPGPLLRGEQRLSRDTVAMICDNAVDSVVAGLGPHLMRLQNDDCNWAQDHVASTLSEQTIDRRAKARVIYDRVSSLSNPMSVDAAVCGLREYLAAWHTEAAEVIAHLLDMVTATVAQDAAQVDWKALADALSQLVRDASEQIGP